MSSQLLTAAEFARVCHTTPRTVRWYQQKGLIEPVKVDESNKYAYFAPEQALQVFRIKLLQQSGLPLNRIKTKLSSKTLSLTEELGKLKELIYGKQKELGLLREINSILISGRFDLKKETIGPHKLFCRSFEKGDYYKLDAYIQALRKVVNDLKLKVHDSEITFYLDPEFKYKPKYSNLQVALIVQKAPNRIVTLPKNYYFRDFPATRVMTFDFRGPYIYLSLVYHAIDRYIKDRNIKIKPPTFEIYLKNPINEKSSFDYLTKIAYPI